MSVREYVGARYAPLFADPIEWSNTRTYEPLTIVEHQGNSYTSRQFVPLGIDIANESFWALTGNYNAQVEQYRQEVQAFDGRITANANGVAENKAAIEALSPLKHSREYLGANIVYMSDSWGAIREGITKPYMELMGEMLGANVYNLSVGSTGFIRGGQDNFINRLTAWVNANPTLVDNIDYVMVCGSSNDYAYSGQQITDAMTAYINYALSAFKNAQIVLVPQFAGRNPAYASIDTTDDNVWRKVALAAVRCYWANTFPRVRMINGTFFALRFTPANFMKPDNVHPTQLGQNYLAKWMVSSLLSGNQGSAIGNSPNLNADLTVSSVDTQGNIVETFDNPESFYYQLYFSPEGVFNANFSLRVTPTKAAYKLVIRSPQFVKFSTGAVQPCWGTAVIGTTLELQAINMVMQDTGKITLPASGAYGQLVIQGFKNGLTAGTQVQAMINVSLIDGFQTAGQN